MAVASMGTGEFRSRRSLGCLWSAGIRKRRRAEVQSREEQSTYWPGASAGAICDILRQTLAAGECTRDQRQYCGTKNPPGALGFGVAFHVSHPPCGFGHFWETNICERSEMRSNVGTACFTYFLDWDIQFAVRFILSSHTL